MMWYSKTNKQAGRIVEAEHNGSSRIRMSAILQKPKKRNYKLNGVSAYKTSEYIAWGNMIQRCYNPNNAEYKNYGARGIKVCDEWMGIGGFIKFIEYIGAKPDKKLTLERANSNGNYEPGNIVWADTKKQALNKRLRCDNKSGYRGVSWNKGKCEWTARIHADGKYAFLGNFETPEEAALAYDIASIQVFGSFGKLNFLGDNQ